MTLQLYMVGVMVEDMARSIEFYRRLGIEIPAGSEVLPHVPIKMGEMTFFLNTKTHNLLWDRSQTAAHEGGYRILLEFYLKSEAAVKAKHTEMLAYGYQNHSDPVPLSNNMCFAFINDPDGNTILLSGDLPAKD